ncbi:MAG: hypothetical protein EWV82_16215 [Microcystis aeruginosa Ma_AC_P_19900807_S299]|nr:MAG: hypothetical protein EWV82_16215 [Microcystis aeruginosa Ma_AC_P_19900807_S299]
MLKKFFVGVGCRVWGVGCRVWGVGCGVWGGHCVRVAGGFGVLVETSPFPHFPISPFPYPLSPNPCSLTD